MRVKDPSLDARDDSLHDRLVGDRFRYTVAPDSSLFILDS